MIYVPSDGETAEKLVAKGLALRDGAQAAVVHLFGVQLNRALGETESALHQRGELANATTLFTEHVRGARRADDDFRAKRRDAHFDARVSILGELANEHLVEFGKEHAIGDELRGDLKQRIYSSVFLILVFPHRIQRAVVRPPNLSQTRAECKRPKPPSNLGGSIAAFRPSRPRGRRGRRVRHAIVYVPCASC